MTDEATIVVKVEEAATTSTAPISESEIDTAAQAVATAHAASALAETQAAEAELDAAARVREIEGRMEEKWLLMTGEVSALKATVTELSIQLQSLTSATTTTATVAEEAKEVATLAAAVVLTDTDTSQTEGQENGDRAKPETEHSEPPKRGKRLFRI